MYLPTKKKQILISGKYGKKIQGIKNLLLNELEYVTCKIWIHYIFSSYFYNYNENKHIFKRKK